MNFSNELFFYYAERLGYLTFDKVAETFKSSEEAIEDYVKQSELLSPNQLCYIKFMFFKHHLLKLAERAGFLHSQQTNVLLTQRLKEIRREKAPLHLQSLEIGVIQPPFFKRVLDNLNARKIFTYQDFTELTSNILSMPGKFVQVIRQQVPKKMPEKTQPRIQAQKAVQKTGAYPEQKKKSVRMHEAFCECGNAVLVKAESSRVLLEIYCKQCGSLMFELGAEPPSVTPFGATFIFDQEPVVEEERIDHYLLVDEVGEGAMGKVYLARDERSQEQVAIKILQKASDDDRFVKYFVREIDLLYQLRHPNIVALKGWGNYEGEPYFVMEYIDGAPLEKYLQRGALPPAHAAQMMGYVLDALTYARDHKIVHRDIKPANIVIGNNGVVKLIDLGLAKIIEYSGSYTKTGQIMGSGYYMAPEQLEDSKYVDHRCDIYAVGATLYHALCGAPPYSEYKGDLRKMFWSKMNNSYIRLGARCELPSEIVQIVEKAMAAEVADRYSDAQQMKQDLMCFYKKQL